MKYLMQVSRKLDPTTTLDGMCCVRTTFLHLRKEEENLISQASPFPPKKNSIHINQSTINLIDEGYYFIATPVTS